MKLPGGVGLGLFAILFVVGVFVLNIVGDSVIAGANILAKILFVFISSVTLFRVGADIAKGGFNIRTMIVPIMKII